MLTIPIAVAESRRNRGKRTTGIGLALLASTLLAQPARASGRGMTDAAGDSPSAEASARARPIAATDVPGPGRQSRVARLLSRAQDRSVPRPARTRSLRGFVLGGLYSCCGGRGGGLAFGGGAAFAMSPGLRLLADGLLIGKPGYRTGFYGSGTVAYQFGSRDSIQPLLGVGLGGLSAGGGGEQLVVGLGYKAGIGQVRVVTLSERKMLVLVLGGVTF